MDHNCEVLKRLEALANRVDRRSKVARLRELFEFVDRLLKNGFSGADVLEELNAAGFDMTMESFNGSAANSRRTSKRIREPRADAEKHRRPRDMPSLWRCVGWRNGLQEKSG